MTKTQRDLPCVEPLHDSWAPFKYAAAWNWVPTSRPATDDVRSCNEWAGAQLTELFDALRPLARVRKVLFVEDRDSPPLPTPVLQWNGEHPHATFEASVIAAAHDANVRIASAELQFDLYAWVKVSGTHAPIRAWIHSSTVADISFSKTDPYGALWMHHTLFRDGDTHGASNTELHSLNQPLLRETLASIETRVGPITEVEGLPDVTKTGFVSHHPIDE